MLGRLIKYEFRATARTLGIFYAALIIISVITRIEMAIRSHAEHGASMFFPTAIVMMLYGAGIAAISVMTLIVIIQRFYKNLLQNEGYLMHTLPVKMWQHIMSKLVVSMVWCMVSMAVIVISIMIIGLTGAGIGDIISMMSANIDFNGAATFAEGIILMLVYGASEILHMYLAMAFGQRAENHKLLVSFGAYIAISVVMQIITGIFMSAVSHISAEITVNIFDVGFPGFHSMAAVHMTLWFMTAVAAVKSAVFFAGTNWLMKNRLNIE